MFKLKGNTNISMSLRHSPYSFPCRYYFHFPSIRFNECLLTLKCTNANKIKLEIK